jgi:phosphopantetheine-binding
MMSTEAILEKVKGYILRTVDGTQITEDTDLFQTGIIHSLFAVQLVVFIEKAFHLELEEEDLTQEHMKTIRDIAKLIEEKQEEE